MDGWMDGGNGGMFPFPIVHNWILYKTAAQRSHLYQRISLEDLLQHIKFGIPSYKFKVDWVSHKPRNSFKKL